MWVLVLIATPLSQAVQVHHHPSVEAFLWTVWCLQIIAQAERGRVVFPDPNEGCCYFAGRDLFRPCHGDQPNPMGLYAGIVALLGEESNSQAAGQRPNGETRRNQSQP